MQQSTIQFPPAKNGVVKPIPFSKEVVYSLDYDILVALSWDLKLE